jgi:hypothetical protein
VNLNDKSTTENLSGIITEMEQKGITRSSDQSKILRREYGMKVAPHTLAEFKSAQRRKALPEITMEGNMKVKVEMEEEVY